MPGPELPALELSGEERLALETLVRRHTAGQHLALRGRIILAAADGLNQSTIATRLGTTINTVRSWRRRWLGLQMLPLAELSVAERLADAPRSGSPARITTDQVCRIVALACETPAESARPISQWTGREVAEEVIKRGIVARISPRHAARILKIGRPQAASHPLLADARARCGTVAQGRRDQHGLPGGVAACRAG
ncbi:MAG: helix-turn-helix domain-containing protein [Acidimicrobiales bacterium]